MSKFRWTEHYSVYGHEAVTQVPGLGTVCAVYLESAGAYELLVTSQLECEGSLYDILGHTGLWFEKLSDLMDAVEDVYGDPE